MSCCAYCTKIAQQDVKLNYATEHQPSIFALLESARSCPLCEKFVAWLGDKKVQEAKEAASKGQATRALVRVDGIFPGGFSLPQNVSCRHLEINARARVWETPRFRMCTSEGMRTSRSHPGL